MTIAITQSYLALCKEAIGTVPRISLISTLKQSLPKSHIWVRRLFMLLLKRNKKKTAKKLLEKMIRLNKDIEIKDFQGVTYLHCAIAVGDLEMTQFLVTKNVNFVRIGWGQQNLLPVTLPILCGHKETARYLYLHTRPEDLKPETGHRGASVLSATIYSTKTLGKNCSFGYIFMSTHLLVIVNYLTFPGLILRCI